MYGYDGDQQNGGSLDNIGQDNNNDPKTKQCPYNLIIIPSQSSWYGLWRGSINLILIWGYFNDPSYIAFVLSIDQQNKILNLFGRPIISLTKPTKDYELIVDILMTMNIILNFITSFQKDVTWVTKFWEIFKNYARGSMVVDIVSTLPCLFTREEDSLYYLKIFRLYHARGAY